MQKYRDFCWCCHHSSYWTLPISCNHETRVDITWDLTASTPSLKLILTNVLSLLRSSTLLLIACQVVSSTSSTIRGYVILASFSRKGRVSIPSIAIATNAFGRANGSIIAMLFSASFCTIVFHQLVRQYLKSRMLWSHKIQSGIPAFRCNREQQIRLPSGCSVRSPRSQWTPRCQVSEVRRTHRWHELKTINLT